MTSFGLFPEGLVIPTLDDVRDMFESRIRDRFGPNFPLGEDDFVGFLVGILSETVTLQWEGLEIVVSSRDPDKATDSLLRAVGLISGTFAAAAAPSTVTLTLCGDDGTVIPTGAIVRTPDTLRQFATDDDATLAALPAWAPTHSYVVGDRVANGLRCFQAIAPGVSDVSGGPLTQDASIADGPDLLWTWIGDGTAVDDVLAKSVDLGPVVAIARGLTDIRTDQAGLNTAINLDDAVLGNLETSNEDFRLLRESEVSAPGTSTAPAVLTELLKLNGIQTVHVFENNTDAVDSDGVPPHNFEALVQGGADQEIFDTIFANKPLGIGTYGSTVGSVTDSQGTIHVIRFSRPTTIPIYVDVTLTKDPDIYGGDDAVKTAIATVASAAQMGLNAVATRVGARSFSVSGVLNLPRSGSLGATLVGTAPSPTSDATIVITSRQLATYSTANVTVHSSDEVP